MIGTPLDILEGLYGIALDALPALVVCAAVLLVALLLRTHLKGNKQ